MQDLMLKVAAAAVALACLGGLAAGLERENALLGATEMCDQGWNQYGPEAGIFHGIVHADVLEFYSEGHKIRGKKKPSLEELITFCKEIGFNPGR